MTEIQLKVLPQWTQVCVTVPNCRPVRKPVNSKFITCNLRQAKVVISKGYAEPVDPQAYLDAGGIFPSDSQVPTVGVVGYSTRLNEEKSNPVTPPEESSTTDETPTAPPETEESPETTSAEQTIEEKLVNFIVENEAGAIAEQIKWVGLETATALKEIEPLTYKAIAEVLDNKQLRSARRFVKEQ